MTVHERSSSYVYPRTMVEVICWTKVHIEFPYFMHGNIVLSVKYGKLMYMLFKFTYSP